MWVQAAEHALESIFDELVAVRLLHIVFPDEVEGFLQLGHIAAKRQPHPGTASSPQVYPDNKANEDAGKSYQQITQQLIHVVKLAGKRGIANGLAGRINKKSKRNP